MTPAAYWMTAVFRRNLEAGPVGRKHVEYRAVVEDSWRPRRGSGDA